MPACTAATQRGGSGPPVRYCLCRACCSSSAVHGQEQEFSFFSSRLLVNFTVDVYDDDQSGLMFLRDGVDADGLMPAVPEGSSMDIPFALMSAPVHDVFVSARSSAPERLQRGLLHQQMF